MNPGGWPWILKARNEAKLRKRCDNESLAMRHIMNKRTLAETDLYIMFQEYEDAFLLEKKSRSELWRTSMYGDPGCGLIAHSNEWALVGGKDLAIWKNNHLKSIEDPDLQWIHDVRQTGKDEVNILTDPWTPHPAIWKFNILTERKTKIRDFLDYTAKCYTEDVKW